MIYLISNLSNIIQSSESIKFVICIAYSHPVVLKKFIIILIINTIRSSSSQKHSNKQTNLDTSILFLREMMVLTITIFLRLYPFHINKHKKLVYLIGIIKSNHK